MEFKRYPLPGYDLDQSKVKPMKNDIIEYESKLIGIAKISILVWNQLSKGDQEIKEIIAGICRNCKLYL